MFRISILGFRILSIAAFLSVVYNRPESEGAEFSLRPSVTVREEYDDNILLTKDNRIDDYITRIMPSVGITYKTPLWDWTLDYTLIWWYYSKRGEGDTSHNLTLMSKVNVIKNLLYLDISDTYSSVVLEPRRPSTEINLAINRTDSNTLNLSPYIKYQIGPATALSAGYRYTNIWYKEVTGIDREMHTGFT
ncbi:MAG: TIGR03016 family PEP-CTERM system-associated outer membrane protein, partial [Nitrospirota bacterium]